MSKIQNIIFIQNRIRFINYIVKITRINKQNLYEYMQNIMNRNNINYNLSINSNYIYNLVNNKLLTISNVFSNIPDITFKNRNSVFMKLKNLKSKLIEIIKITGSKNINDLIMINYDIQLDKLFKQNNELLMFLNNNFNPISYDIYYKNKNKNNNNNKCKKMVVFNDDDKIDKIDNNFINSDDYNNISFLNKIYISKNLKNNNNLVLSVNGARVYIEVADLKQILIIDGYFNKDNINLLRMDPVIKYKISDINKKMKLININKIFLENYIEQLSIRDILIYQIDEIMDLITKDYNKLMEFKKYQISDIVKKFLNSKLDEQRNILMLFLIIEDMELQYIGHLLYDMVNNDSYLLKSQPLSEQIYNNLHWSVQKNYKSIIKNINKYKKNMSLSFDEFTYEKKIMLMKVPDNIKQKAFEKLKEINNKGNDNSSKSQQYLDSLLKIPFNIYKKEEILTMLSINKNTTIDLLKYLTNLLTNLLNNTLPPNTQSRLNDILVICKKFNNSKHLYYSDIDSFIGNLFDINKNNILYFNNQTNIDLNNINYINKIICLFIVNTKNKDINTLVKYINNELKNYNIRYKEKTTKEKYKEIFNNFFTNNNINIDIKKKYFFQIQNIKLEEIDIIDDDNLKNCLIQNYDTINDKINNLYTKWDKYKIKRKKYLIDVDTILNNAIYSQNDAKKEIKRIIGQWINGKMTGYCLGFEGPPGIGKTSLAKKGISKCFIDSNNNPRPFYFIALGGSSNGSILEGHNYTYVGSTYGKIIDILIETQCMNPIIYIDELDKISNTENGKEIIGILTHLTDSTQNDEFTDKYFSGIKFDLSQVLFIFSYNDFSKLDPILADRIHRIQFRYLSKNEKITIMKDYMIPELLETVGYNNNSITFKEEIIKYIITNYTLEAGVRKLKEVIFEIIREINLQIILGEKSIDSIDISVTDIQKIFESKTKISFKKIANNNYIGLVNGLYATSVGIGGITIIQAFKTYSETTFSLMITGQQGDVMKESIQCAKTITWNLLPDDYKKKIQKEWKKNNCGIHIHCPEAATPKDGPSAGGAITLAIISLFCNIKVRNNVGITGEIDLSGNIHSIGGLDLKLDGGKEAGITTFLVPKSNSEDIEIIKKEKPELFDNIEIILIETINEILDYSLEDNDMEFNKLF